MCKTPTGIATEVLYKCAEKKPNKKSPRSGLLGAGAGVAVGRIVVDPLGRIHNDIFTPMFVDALQNSSSPSDAKRLARKLLQSTGNPRTAKIPIYTNRISEKLKEVGPHYMPEGGRLRKYLGSLVLKNADKKWAKDIIDEVGATTLKGEEYIHVGGKGLSSAVGTHPFVIAHEVGHASRTNAASKLLGRVGRSLTARALPLGLLAGGALATDATDSEVSKAVKAAPWVAGANAAIRATEELRASLRGRKLLKQIGTSPKNINRLVRLQLLGQLVPSLHTAAPILGGAILVKYWHRNARRAAEQKAAKRRRNIRQRL